MFRTVMEVWSSRIGSLALRRAGVRRSPAWQDRASKIVRDGRSRRGPEAYPSASSRLPGRSRRVRTDRYRRAALARSPLRPPQSGDRRRSPVEIDRDGSAPTNPLQARKATILPTRESGLYRNRRIGGKRRRKLQIKQVLQADLGTESRSHVGTREEERRTGRDEPSSHLRAVRMIGQGHAGQVVGVTVHLH